MTEPRPWDGEPDAVDLVTVAGFRAAARRMTPWGTWAGYLEVPPGHPWYGPAGDMPGPFVVARPGEDFPYAVPLATPDGWWLGFDTLGASHIWPIMLDDQHYAGILGALRRVGARYAGIDDVLCALEALATQAAEAGPPHPVERHAPREVFDVLPRPFTMLAHLGRQEDGPPTP